MKHIVIVRGDTNDADYITKETILTDENTEILRKVTKAIKQRNTDNNDKPNWHNWDNSEFRRGSVIDEYEELLTEDDIEYFSDEFVPYGEHGIHTIESIRIVKIAEDIDLLK